MAGEKENKMEKIRVNQLQANQIEVYTDKEIRFYSYNTCICVWSYESKKFVLSENENHFSKTTVKWLNRFLVKFDTCYKDIKQTASREKLN